MTFSNSKMKCCLGNPMDYYLKYKIGISPKQKKKALQIGSAMHWGFEHDTEDLTEWFAENGTEDQRDGTSEEQEQAEAMAHGYFFNKEKIFSEVMEDYDTGVQIQKPEKDCIWHELEVSAPLKSLKHPDQPHTFMGIIDLLLLTERGFILLDYKSSSQIPDFSKYLDQIYRYVFLLEQNFPEVPVYKIGIINIVKSKIKKKREENESEFKNRWKKQYEEWPSHLINVNMFERSKLDQSFIDKYIENLSREADLIDAIDRDGLYYINWQNAKEPYESDYIDIYEGREGAFLLYSIRDTVLDPYTGVLAQKRDCFPSDMQITEKKNVLFSSREYLKEKREHRDMGDVEFRAYIREKYIISDELLEIYEATSRDPKFLKEN